MPFKLMNDQNVFFSPGGNRDTIPVSWAPIPENPQKCPRSNGIGAHDAPEYAIKLVYVDSSQPQKCAPTRCIKDSVHQEDASTH